MFCKKSTSNSKDTRINKTLIAAVVLQKPTLPTLAKTEIIYPKNVRAKVAMNFTEQLKK